MDAISIRVVYVIGGLASYYVVMRRACFNKYLQLDVAGIYSGHGFGGV